jgi:hypothetical protein
LKSIRSINDNKEYCFEAEFKEKDITDCIFCNKIFCSKKHLCDHLKNCKTKIDKENEVENNHNLRNKYECNYCHNIFTRSDSLNKHISERCKIKKQQDQEKEDLMTRLIKEKEDQKKEMNEIKKLLENKDKEMVNKNNQIEEIMKKMENIEKLIQNKNTKIVNNSNNTANSNNTVCGNKIQNNIHNEFKIIAYGKEDLSHLKDKDYKMILNKGFKSVPELMESIHFNKNKPENHNIYISNLRDNHVLVYNGTEWQLRERDDVLLDMVYIKSDILTAKFDELVDRLDEVTIKKFRRFLEQKDDDDVINSIKKDLKLLMYNKRKMVENTRNRISNNENMKMIENN